MSMRSYLLLAAFLILIFLIGFKFWGNVNGNEVQDINISAAEQLEIAKGKGEPVWLMFGTRTCGFCIELKKIFEELKVDYEGKVTFIEVDLDDKENQELGIRYEIMYVPENYIYDKNGDLSFSQGGLLDKDLLIQELDKVSQE